MAPWKDSFKSNKEYYAFQGIQSDIKKNSNYVKTLLLTSLFSILNSKTKIMSHIIIDTEAFNKLMNKLDAIEDKLNHGFQEPEDLWWDNQQLCNYLNISARTLQTYRDDGVIKYSQYGAKIWYRYKDVQIFLEKNRIK